MSIEALKQIADIAEGSTTANSLQHIAKIARQAIAEAEKQEQGEPVAHFGSAYVNENGVHITTVLGPVAIPQDAKLYTKPQPSQKPWVGLTDEDVTWLCSTAKSHNQTWRMFVRTSEAKLKEKNT